VRKMRPLIWLIAATTFVGALPSAVASPSQTGHQLIAFERWVGDGDHVVEIWVMESDGSRQRKLADGCCFAWSPDGRVIAFDGAHAAGLSTINADGTSLRRVTADSVDGAPSWSPDGKQLVYGSSRADGLFAVAVGGGTPKRLTHGNDDSPDWSPNGRKIVFGRFLFRPKANGDAIFVVNADGSGVRQLTEIGHYTPVWSPGGKTIACWGGESEFEQGVHVMNADGSDRRLVGRTPHGGWGPAWSPGGGRIVFVSDRAIHTIRPDGRRHKRVARGRNDEPYWSQDGRSIVFRRETKHQWDIWVMTTAGKDAKNLTHTPKPLFEDAPAWSPAR
jgi:TolB protein